MPSGYSKSTPIPLVVFIHGYDPGNPNVVQAEADFFRLSVAAEARTVLLALPEGPRDFSGLPAGMEAAAVTPTEGIRTTSRRCGR